jgi:hypothetical protein
MDKCEALLDLGTFDVHEDHDGDTLQCRIVHLANATVQPIPHCGHSQIIAPTQFCNWLIDEGEPNVGRPNEPSCDDYCRVIGVACGGAQAVYESDDQCQAVCEHLDAGEFTDTVENTRGCRIYHSYNALCAPSAHCPHAAPSGDGHCGELDAGNCESYCALASRICSDEFDGEFGDEETCLEDCADIDGADGNSGYSVAMGEEGGDTLACRFLALSRAAEDDAECPAAFGEDPCD